MQDRSVVDRDLDWGDVGKRLLIPIVLGFALLYAILRPVANLLLHTLQVSSTVYSAVIWTLTAVALVLVAYLVVRSFRMSGPRPLLAVVVAAFLSCAFLSVFAWWTTAVASDVRWLYSEPASIGLMVISSTATALISFAVGGLVARRPVVGR